MSKLKEKVAVVTGAGSGIGRALAHELARRGARLALSDVNESGLAETAEQVRALDATVHTARLDVSDRAAFAAYARAIAAHYGVVHQLYNNAGIAGVGRPVVETEYASFERILAVNLWGVIHGTRELLPHLIASGDGHLINISSLNGFMAQSHLAAYCTSQFGVRGFTEAVRAELLVAGHPVCVTVVHPGGIKTNIANATLVEAAALPAAERAKHERRTQIYNEKLFRTTAAQAAQTILNGVEAGQQRILVGSDAKIVDLLVRLFPTAYTQIAVRMQRRRFGELA